MIKLFETNKGLAIGPYSLDYEELYCVPPFNIREELLKQIIEKAKEFKNPKINLEYDDKYFNWKYVIREQGN